jgi:hypothetical protein
MGKERQFFFYYLACQMKGKKNSCMLNERHLKKIGSHCERAKKKRKRVLVKSKAKMKI